MEEKSDYLYAKVHKHVENNESCYGEGAPSHRTIINGLVEQMRVKYNCRELKELARAIDKWHQWTDNQL
jgi:ribulose 1,5-bisphosphate carboxylase large subunit-like protein